MSESPFQNVVAVVLAGGLGTRIRHLLPDLPKPMAPVAGRPFLDWVLRFLARQGLQRVVLSIGYRADVVKDYFHSHPVGPLDITCVAEPEPMGTGGGCVHAVRASALQASHWLVLNGDTLVLTDLKPLLHGVSSLVSSGAILGVAVSDTARFGSLALDPSGNLTGFVEKHPGRGIISAGVYLLPDSIWKSIPDKRPLSFESDLFPKWLNNGVKLKGVITEAPFLDIGTEESLAQAEAFVRAHGNFFLE